MSTFERGELFGVPIDLLTMAQTIGLVHQSIISRRLLQHVAINVAKLVTVQKDRELRNDVLNSEIVGVDGAGVIVAARLLGIKVPERVAGIDLMMETLALCAREGFRPYFFGATEEVLNRAINNAIKRWPGLTFAGKRNGYFKPEEENDIVDDIRDSGADCLFVAISSPIKERFCHKYRTTLNVPFIMGVGGSLDVLAGKTPRAPLIMQNWGLEWAFRLAQEPRRMWRRYLRTNSIFAWMLLHALLTGRRGRTATNSSLENYM